MEELSSSMVLCEGLRKPNNEYRGFEICNIKMTSSNGNIFNVTGQLWGEIHRSSVDSPHKGQWRGVLMLFLICAWTNVWANNGDTGDLRHHRTHYDAAVMLGIQAHIPFKHFTKYFVYVISYISNVRNWILSDYTWISKREANWFPEAQVCLHIVNSTRC